MMTSKQTSQSITPWQGKSASSVSLSSKKGKAAALTKQQAFLQLQSVVGAKAAAKAIRYKLGAASEPALTFDEDFVYNPAMKPSTGDRASWAWWGFKRAGANVVSDTGFRPLADALEAYEHYRAGTGTDLKIDYEKAYAEDSVVKTAVDQEIRIAQEEAELLFMTAGADSFEMTGNQVRVDSGATENWQKTIGRHIIWGNAYVKVQGEMFSMTLTIHEVDRYNFNRGEADIASGAPDDVNGRFTELGWAKSFLTRGQLKRFVTWKKGDIPGSSTIYSVMD